MYLAPRRNTCRKPANTADAALMKSFQIEERYLQQPAWRGNKRRQGGRALHHVRDHQPVHGAVEDEVEPPRHLRARDEARLLAGLSGDEAPGGIECQTPAATASTSSEAQAAATTPPH